MNAFINEFHYDNAGADVGEFIEIAGLAGTDLTGWSIVLYNGSNGASYNTLPLNGVLTDAGDGYGFLVVDVAGLQNGAPDGFALVDDLGNVLEFLSYEGSLTAVDGPAAGLTSTDVGVSEPGTTPVGFSLQRTGAGSEGADFAWAAAQEDTRGMANTGQSFNGGTPLLTINEIRIDQPGADNDEYFELFGAPGASLDGLSYIVIGDGAGGSGVIESVVSLDGFTLDENGFFLGTEDTFTLNGENDASLSLNFENSDNVTHLLVRDFTGASGDDLDTDDDGVLDATPWSEVVDSVALIETVGSGDQVYSDTQVGPDGTFVPGHIYRATDGTGAFLIGAFDPAAGGDTPGLTNEGPPPPAVITLISEIQGSSDFSALPGLAQVGTDDRSALEGQVVTIRAIVTADFQSGANGVIGSDLSGFFVQEEDADWDDDAFTSEGIFIFDDFAAGNPDVQVGDLVEITGSVAEFFGQTQIGATMIEVIASNQMLPSATAIDYGSTGVMLDADGEYVVNLETVEGMRITIEEAMTVSEMFNLDRFGEYRVSADGRPEQFTQNNAPDVAGYDAHLQDVAARGLVLDDGQTGQNPDFLEIIDGDNGVLDSADSFRMGDEISNLAGVVAYGFDEFRVHDATGDYSQQNPRPETPEDIGGTLKIASLNVLNYFATIDTGANNSGPDDTLEPRGADSQEEFDRQVAKIVSAIVAMDADILGLVELENDNDEAIADLVARVNEALGADVYDYIATGDLGGDAITNGIIYKKDFVDPVGDFAALTEFNGESFLDPLGAGRDLNRPALAQTFYDVESGQEITVVVNHLKSKGSLSGDPLDEDQGDGQGNNNATRTEAARILAEWMASDPTGTGAENQVILGDLNAYAQEDPLQALADAGFTDLAQALLGEEAYSFVFDGQIGTLDYILANEALLTHVAGITEWHINADEADAIDYNLDFGRDPALYNADTAARNSDHDPVIVSFDFAPIVLGTDQRDMLTGTERGEVIDGLGGKDKMTGLGGADIFVLGDGDHDQVRDFSVEEDDRLDVSAWGVQSFDEMTIRGNGRAFQIFDAASGNKANILLADPAARAGDLTEDSFIFAPDSGLTLVGDAKRDWLVGRSDDDILDGGLGRNFLEGGGGADTFVIASGSRAKILDYKAGVDIVDLSDWAATSFEDLTILDHRRSIVIRDGADKLTLRNRGEDIDADDLVPDSFIFAPDTLV